MSNPALGLGGSALFRGPPRVLLALRSAETRAELVATLVERTFEVIEALDGAHLWRLLRTAFHLRACEPPDVIVCPLHLDGCDAGAVMATVRQLGRPTSVVFTSSDASSCVAPFGAAAILQPPLDPPVVASLLWELAHRPPSVDARAPSPYALQPVSTHARC